MAKKDITIDNLFNGQAPTYYKGGSYLSSFGIDPGKKINGKTGGVISPTSIEANGDLNGNVMFAVPNPYTSNTLLYTDTGRLYLADANNDLLGVDEAGNVFPQVLTSASGNGLVFYNNYYYIFKDTDIDRYGPFTDTANLAFETNWWTSLTFKETVHLENTLTGVIDELEQLTVTGNTLLFNDAVATRTRAAAQKLAYDITATGESVTLNKFDILLEMLNSGTLASQTGDIRVSIQTESAGFPSGTRLAEVTVPIRTIPFADATFSDVDYATVWPNAFVALASLQFDTPFVWNYADYTTLFLVIEVINTTGLTAGTYVTVGNLGTDWVSADSKWTGYAVVEKYTGAAWAWENYNAGTAHSLFFRFYDDVQLMTALENPDYTSFVGTLPNHSSHIHRADNNLYYPNKNNVGRIQTRKSMFLAFRGESLAQALPLTPGNTIIGETSGARATIVNTVSNEADQNDTVPSSTGVSGYPTNQYVVVEVTEGTFTVGERLMNISRFPFAKLLEYKDGFYTGQFTNPSALDLPSTKKVTDISSYGVDLAFLTHQDNGDSFESSMVLWDTVSPQFTREVPIRNNLATAIFSGLGSVNVFYGDDDGYSLGTYVGGERFSNLLYRDDSLLPFPGAIVTEYDRVMWGTKQTYPESRLSVLSYGMLDSTLPRGVHNLYAFNVDAAATALAKYPNLGIFSNKVYVESDGLPTPPGRATASVLRTSMYTLNGDFDVRKIKFSLERPVDALTGIEVRVYYDNESRSELVDTISATKFTGKRVITLKPNAGGYNNFFVEFKYTGDDNGILLPINIQVETKESA